MLKVTAGNTLTKGDPHPLHQGTVYQAAACTAAGFKFKKPLVMMSGRPRKHGWFIWEWFPRWDDNGLTHWWSQERCASCTRSQYGSFAKREGHARAQLQKTRLWCCRTPLHVCDCRGQTLNELMFESISGNFISKKTCVSFCLSSGLSWHEN